MQKPANSRIPALVVSGFLGSGKTSLVRHLLAEAVADGLRLAIVSNEFGELGIDRELLGAGGEAFVELEGGCVCCELSDDLVLTLQRLHEEIQPDRIVIETSGVALPFDTQLNFWRDPVSDWIGDDMALVVVNADQVAEGRDLEGTFTDQVTSADLLVLNKIDQVDHASLATIEERLRVLEPDAPIVRSEHGRIDPQLCFPTHPETVDRRGTAPPARPHTHEQFVSEWIEVESGIDEAQLIPLLEEPGLLRAKGFVSAPDGCRLVQVVGRRIEFTPCDPPRDSSVLNRIVRIRRATPSDG